MKIKKGKTKDIEGLLPLLEELFTKEAEFVFEKRQHKKGLKKIIENKKIGTIFVVKKRKRVIACINVLYTISTALGGKVALLEDVVVSKAYQKKGIGTKLLRYVLAFLEKQRIKRITLLTDYDNTTAHHFYKKNSFVNSSMIVFRSYF